MSQKKYLQLNDMPDMEWIFFKGKNFTAQQEKRDFFLHIICREVRRIMKTLWMYVKKLKFVIFLVPGIKPRLLHMVSKCVILEQWSKLPHILLNLILELHIESRVYDFDVGSGDPNQSNHY